MWASSQSSEVDLEKLKAPTSPASTIIGIQPSEISRPKSVKDLELAMYNNFTSEGSLTLPTEYALEVMPYWMFNRKNINELDYLDNVGWRSGWSNLSVSVATSTSYKLADTVNSNAIGVGVRTILYRSKLKGRAKQLAENIYANRINEALNIDISYSIDDAADEEVDLSDFNAVKEFAWNNIFNAAEDTFCVQKNDDHYDYFGFASSKDLKRSFDAQFDLLEPFKDSLSNVDSWEDRINEIRKPLKELYSVDSIEYHLTDYLTNRQGFQLEMAGAVSVNFPTNDFQYSRVPQWGLWFTGTYQDEAKSVMQYLMMARYIKNDVEFYKQFQVNDSVNASDSYDLGGKLVLFPGRKFTAEIEATARYQVRTVDKIFSENNAGTEIEKDWNYRWLLNINYQVKDNFVLTYSFGKGFDPLFTVNGNVISSLGINFGFGNPTISGPKK